MPTNRSPSLNPPTPAQDATTPAAASPTPSMTTPLVPPDAPTKLTKFSSMHDLLEGANERTCCEASVFEFKIAKKTD